MKKKVHLPHAFEPQILYTRAFRSKFARCIGHHPVRVDFVSPFVTGTPWGSVAQFFDMLLRRNCYLSLVTCPPSESDKSVLTHYEASRLEKMGVSLKIYTSPPLHSKIYQFSYANGAKMSFVGSANLTLGGFRRNAETVAFFQSQADNEKVRREIQRYSAVGTPHYLYMSRRI